MKLKPTLALATAFAVIATPALAHPGHVGAQGLVAGFVHPMSGIDHILVMLAVGIFGTQLGGRAIYLLPLTFVSVMAVGGLLGMSGLELPFVETLIAISVLAMGTAVALGLRMPVSVAMAAVGVFALFHGVAHGSEMPQEASGYAYGAGFLAATSILHAIGIGLGLAMFRLPRAQKLVGAVMAATGIGLITGWI